MQVKHSVLEIWRSPEDGRENETGKKRMETRGEETNTDEKIKHTHKHTKFTFTFCLQSVSQSVSSILSPSILFSKRTRLENCAVVVVVSSGNQSPLAPMALANTHSLTLTLSVQRENPLQNRGIQQTESSDVNTALADKQLKRKKGKERGNSNQS